MQKSLHAWIGEAQRCRALIVHGDRSLHVLEGGFADEAIVTDALDVKQTSVRRKADLAQLLEIFDASPMAKSRVSLIVVSVRSACPSLWYCLMRVFL